MEPLNSILKAPFHQMVGMVVLEVMVDKELLVVAAAEAAAVEEVVEEEYYLTARMLQLQVQSQQTEDLVG
jgi:hypothetical protein